MSSVLLPSSARYTVHNSHALKTKDNSPKDNYGLFVHNSSEHPLPAACCSPCSRPGCDDLIFLPSSFQAAAAWPPPGRCSAVAPRSSSLLLASFRPNSPSGARCPAAARYCLLSRHYSQVWLPTAPPVYGAPLSSLVLYRRSRSKYGAFSQCWSTDCLNFLHQLNSPCSALPFVSADSRLRGASSCAAFNLLLVLLHLRTAVAHMHTFTRVHVVLHIIHSRSCYLHPVLALALLRCCFAHAFPLLTARAFLCGRLLLLISCPCIRVHNTCQ